jgi:general L-amino acid transport system permease protein
MFATTHETPPASTNPVRKAWAGHVKICSPAGSTLLTLLCLWVICNVIPPALNWLVFQANWLGTTRADCTKEGACWVFIHARFGQFMYGLYPHELRWRINLALVTGLLSIIPMFIKSMPRRGRYIACWAVSILSSSGA